MLLLLKLLKGVHEIFQFRISIGKINTFLDSKTVLQWFTTPYIIDISVANRIVQIKKNYKRYFPEVVWSYVERQTNPVYCFSKGLLPSGLINHSFCLKDPSW